MNEERVITPPQAGLYGLLGLPLAFVALPLYVLLPHHYAREFGVPLATLGVVLLGSRLFDAVVDPWLGRVCDRLFQRSSQAVRRTGAAVALVLALAFAALFFPPWPAGPALLWGATGLLVLTYTSYSALSLAHQSWGALLGASPAVQSRLLAWREGLGLVGVLLASVLPVALGLPAMVGVFWGALLLGVWGWWRAPEPAPATSGPAGDGASAPGLGHPWQQGDFVRLLAVFLINGIASAVPATLVLFFIQDRLQASAALEPVFLGSYFLAAALSMTAWLGAVRRWGLVRSWLAGMGLAVAVFIWAATLGAGDHLAFVLICVLSGAALGADLVMPGALLAGVVERAGDLGRAQGAYYGWWNFATKLNLALAAGLSLPLLAALGYAPGAREPAALQALTAAYCLLPCVLKLLAMGLLYILFLKRGAS